MGANVPSEAEVEAVLREHESCDYVITDDYDAAFECGIVVKALPSPSLAAMGRRHLAAALLAPLADAWDAGYDHGDPYHRRGNPDEGKAANPYRAPRTAPTTEGDPT